MLKKLIKILFPIVRSLIYKEGDDKMKLLKNYLTKVWGNKITGTLSAIPFAGVVYFAFDFPSVFVAILAVAVAFIIAFNVAVFFGGETLAQIQARLADAKLTKEEKQKVKDIEARAKEIAKQNAKQSQERFYAQAKALVEEEAKAKAQQAE